MVTEVQANHGSILPLSVWPLSNCDCTRRVSNRCDIYKVVKVVHRNWSQNDCSLCYQSSTSKHPVPFSNTHTCMRTHSPIFVCLENQSSKITAGMSDWLLILFSACLSEMVKYRTLPVNKNSVKHLLSTFLSHTHTHTLTWEMPSINGLAPCAITCTMKELAVRDHILLLLFHNRTVPVCNTSTYLCQMCY